MADRTWRGSAALEATRRRRLDGGEAAAGERIAAASEPAYIPARSRSFRDDHHRRRRRAGAQHRAGAVCRGSPGGRAVAGRRANSPPRSKAPGRDLSRAGRTAVRVWSRRGGSGGRDPGAVARRPAQPASRRCGRATRTRGSASCCASSTARFATKIEQNLANCSVLSLAWHSAATYAAAALDPTCFRGDAISRAGRAAERVCGTDRRSRRCSPGGALLQAEQALGRASSRSTATPAAPAERRSTPGRG